MKSFFKKKGPKELIENPGDWYRRKHLSMSTNVDP